MGEVTDYKCRKHGEGVPYYSRVRAHGQTHRMCKICHLARMKKPPQTIQESFMRPGTLAKRFGLSVKTVIRIQKEKFDMIPNYTFRGGTER